MRLANEQKITPPTRVCNIVCKRPHSEDDFQMSTIKNEIMLPHVRPDDIVQICKYECDCSQGMREECVKYKKD
jgi:hypothetical protein